MSLPEVGCEVTAGETCGEVESTKSVSDLYAPVERRRSTARNEALDANPELVNTDPYGEGWMFEVRPTEPGRRRRPARRRAPYRAQLARGALDLTSSLPAVGCGPRRRRLTRSTARAYVLEVRIESCRD